MTAQKATVLLIDDDRDMRWAMRNVLTGAGFEVAEAHGGQTGLELAAQQPPDAVVLDICMPGMRGEEVLRQLLDRDRHLPVVVATAYASVAGAVGAMKDGAFEYITKPFRNEHFVQSVKRAVSRRRAFCSAPAVNVRAAVSAVMGQGPAIQKLIDEIEAVVHSEYSVVIEGESGSGKEIVARSLHQHGRRAASPLVIVDCGAVAESLINSEFFGHEKGSFTGAVGRHQGWFEAAANGGTIFLDEVGNLVPSGQKALLRTLEERKIRRVGSTEPINLDLRVIAATNEDLKSLARAGAFREDLYYRLSEYMITVPPLRARPEDVPFLARRFLTEARESLGRGLAEISSDALDMLCSHSWPGNVRELRNVMRRLALAPSDILGAAHVAGPLGGSETPPPQPRDVASGSASLRDRVRGQVRAVERDAILAALSSANGNKAEAARLLGIDYKTYRMKLKMLEQGGDEIRQ